MVVVTVAHPAIQLPEIGSSIALADIYENVEFPPDDRPTVSGA